MFWKTLVSAELLKGPIRTTCNPCTEHPAWKHQQEPEEPNHEEGDDKDTDLVAECALGGLGVGVEDEGVRDFHLQPIFQQYSKVYK